MSSPTDALSSEPAFNVAKDSQITSAQNVIFTDADSPWAYHISSELDDTYKMGGTTDSNLGDFLSRPLKIASYQWTPTAQLFETFNPWKLFFDNPQIIEKMNYFRNFRSTLCLKIMINGNSFYYGRALLSYNPYLTNDGITRNRAFFEQDIVEASQRPHVLIDPCSSQGAVMCLPFIYPENWLDTTVAGYADELGECTIHDFDVLRHANGGSDPITVNVFAWAENVELCVPTSKPVQAVFEEEDESIDVDPFGYPVAQAGGPKKNKAKKTANNKTRNDEFKSDGLISKPASAIAAAANALSMIPMIAPYAKATSMVATKIGQVAHLFGYSRPQICSDIQPYTPRYMGNLSNTDASEALIKLSVDSKNELTVDSRVTGMDGTDELTIQSIASRECYVTNFDWPETAVSNDLLFSIQVDPTVVRTLVASPATEIHQTPMGFAAQPFKYWQGTINFRFTIVCSEYHRGRLRVVFDPNQVVNTGFNLTYSTVIDIAEDRDFEYNVQWVVPRAWQDVRPLSTAQNTTYFSDVAPIVPTSQYTNGTLSVYVLNELATPAITPADVKVLVWMSAGDDFAVACPRSYESLQSTSVFQQQSSWSPTLNSTIELCEYCDRPYLDCSCYERQNSDPRCTICYESYQNCGCCLDETYTAQSDDVMATTTDASNKPVNVDPVPSFDSMTIPQDNQYLVYQGERIVSFRDLLSRYHYHDSYFLDTNAQGDVGISTWLNPNFPKYRGWDPNGSEAGVNSLTQTSSYNYCAETLMNYLSPAFVCRRGGIRWKYVYSGPSPDHIAHLGRIDTQGPQQFGFDNLSSATNTVNNGGVKKLLLQNYLTGSGASVTPTRNNPVLEVELPFYTNGQRFEAARRINTVTSSLNYRHQISGMATATAEQGVGGFLSYVAAGEDFNLTFFIATPVLFSYDDPTAVQSPP